jgi:hypothetical protein
MRETFKLRMSGRQTNLRTQNMWNLSDLKSLEFWIKTALFFAFLSFFLPFLSYTTADFDLWGYLSFGRLFWGQEHFPFQDVFAYVPTLKPWIYHEWLTGVLFYPLYQTFGAPGLQTIKYGLALVTICLVYLTALNRGANPLAVALFEVITFMQMFGFYYPVRAQVLTFFFFALSLYFLERARLSNRWRALYLLPLIQIPWCNLHGGFLAGLGLNAIYLTGEVFSHRPFWHYLLVFLLSTLATLINPYGVYYWEYLFRAIIMPRPYIVEWNSVLQAYQYGMVRLTWILCLLASIFIALFGIWRSRWREITPSLALVVTFVLALKHFRHFPFFLILLAVYVPVCLNVKSKYLKLHPALKRLWGMKGIKIEVLIFLSILIIINLNFFIVRNPFNLQTPRTSISQETSNLGLYYPVDAVKYIKKQGISGKILTAFRWGEYLIWELYPQCLVAFDGRYETVYPPKVEKEYFEFYYGRSRWRQFIEDYPTDLILLNKRMKVVKLIQNDLGWRMVYSDSSCILFRAYQNENQRTLDKRCTSR